jgi:site-specific DNA-methyltransferase (adenine-specific)
MNPYYQDDFATIYHGDCREVLPVLDPHPDLVLTDPPYGVAFQLEAGVTGKGHRRRMRGGKPAVHGDDEPFDPSHLLAFPRLVLFGANHYSDRLPVSGGWIVWDKTGGGRGPVNQFADVEMAWTNVVKTPRIMHHLWKGLVRDSEAGDTVLHPTQKPVALMRWIVNQWSSPGGLILDPYMGSGPVGRAAKDCGRRYIGVEIEEAYCEIAARRLSQEVLDFGGVA